MSRAPGKELNLGSWVAGRQFVEDYLNAVGDKSSVYSELDAVPPLALAARALGALIKELALPPGTIHAGQELDCRRMAKWGEEVSCIARMSRPIHRGGWQFISAEFAVYGAGGETLLTGKSTVLVPADELEGEGPHER